MASTEHADAAAAAARRSSSKFCRASGLPSVFRLVALAYRVCSSALCLVCFTILITVHTIFIILHASVFISTRIDYQKQAQGTVSQSWRVANDTLSGN